MKDVKLIIRSKIWISSWVAVILVLVVLPLLLSPVNNYYLPRGKVIQRGGDFFYQFIEQVRENDGLLILGTSETANTMGGHNYWKTLQKDESFPYPVYQLSGAGRNIHTYFPHLLNKPESFKGLRVLYYVNPIYWSDNLSQFHEGYYKRYVSSELINKIEEKAKERGVYDDFMSPSMTFSNQFETKTELYWEKYKNLFSGNLKSFVNGDDLKKINDPFKGLFREQEKVNFNSFYNNSLLTVFQNEIDLENNVTPAFLSKNKTQPPINKDSDFHERMLIKFIQLAKELEIDVTFYLGPYNQIYCNNTKPEYIKDYEQVILNIKSIFEKEQVSFIDGTNQNNIPGTFVDIQHTSKYGAYITTQQIKDHYEKQ